MKLQQQIQLRAEKFVAKLTVSRLTNSQVDCDHNLHFK